MTIQKLLSLASITLLLASANIEAQYTILNSSVGGYGSPTLSGSVLYGMTRTSVFKINVDGTGLQFLHTFSASAGAYGDVTVSGSSLYGVTVGNGDSGTVFKVNSDGTGFQTLHTFVGGTGDGERPGVGLIMSGSQLYGMTELGGSSNSGTVFKVNADGTGFQILRSFTGGTDGSRPSGKLFLSGSILYGMTRSGGAHGGGTIFRMNLDGSGYAVLHAFERYLSGRATQSGSLILSGSTLFGMTFGDLSYPSTIFKINTDGTGFTILRTLSVSDGYWPRGTVTLSGSVLYGMSGNGGSSGGGTIFKMNTDGSNFTVLHNFVISNANGFFPYGTLVLSGSTLYGMTAVGGVGEGVIFSFGVSGCGYSISPTSVSYGSSGGNGSLGVTAGSGCGWTATSNDGWITITSGSSGTGNGTVNYSVAANSGASSRTGTMTIAGQTVTVLESGATPTPPTITTLSPLPSGVVESSYSTTLAASGGTPPYTWLVVSNGLPAGLTLNSSTGAITGTPTEIATTNFTVRVTGANSLHSEKALTLTITPPVPPTITTASPLPSGSVETVYGATVAATGGKLPYTWSVALGSLPMGLVLESSTGAITGTPLEKIVASFTVRVTGANSLYSEKAFGLTIIGPPPRIVTTSPLPVAMVSRGYSQELTAIGGTPPYTWSGAPGCPGLSLTGSIIDGIPSVPCQSYFTIRCTGGDGAYSEKILFVFVYPASSKPVITTTGAWPGGMVGVGYSRSMQAIGGVTPYSWSLAEGALPGGVSVNSSTGEISGTPSTAGTFNFTIRCAGADNQYADSLVSLAITSAPFTIDPPPLVINALATLNGIPIVLAGEPGDFTVGATSMNGSHLDCSWDFGDGGTGTNWNTSHVFANCGPQTVTAAISDGVATVNTNVIVAVPCAFAELPKPASLKMKSNFAPGKLDTATLKASFDMPVGFGASNTPVTLQLAGVEVPFTLNAKGQAVNAFSSIKISHKGTGTLWQVSAKLKGDYDAVWQNAGLTNATVTAVPITVPVLLLFDMSAPESFYMEKPLLYKATAGKSGTGQ